MKLQTKNRLKTKPTLMDTKSAMLLQIRLLHRTLLLKLSLSLKKFSCRLRSYVCHRLKMKTKITSSSIVSSSLAKLDPSFAIIKSWKASWRSSRTCGSKDNDEYCEIRPIEAHFKRPKASNKHTTTNFFH